jgi:integrase
MEGHVRKRGEKWYYSFEASTVDGKRKRIERVGGRTKKEAEAALRVALQEYNNAGLHFEPSEISVADYLDYWLKNYVLLNCKYNTRDGYEMMIKNHIKPTLGSYKLKSLTPAILQEFINLKFLSGFSKHHLTNLITVLAGSLKYAVHPCKFIKETPMQYVKYPRYEHSKMEVDHKIISNENFNKIIERFPLGSNFYIPIMIGYYTGCRIGEVMGLTWDDINLEKGTIDINKIIYKRKPNWYFGSTKTKSSVRNIKIGETLIDALKKYKVWQTDNKQRYDQHYIQQYEVEELDKETSEKLRRIYSLEISVDSGTMNSIDMVCTKENGEMITPDTFKYASRVIHYSLGILFNFHSLRHTHATVQMRLGHANIETTLGIYTADTEKMIEQSVNIFEKATNITDDKNDLPTE